MCGLVRAYVGKNRDELCRHFCLIFVFSTNQHVVTQCPGSNAKCVLVLKPVGDGSTRDVIGVGDELGG